ncbi:hypothetical protein CHUAL_011745 [Chamberlinius hualienensis]
MVVAVDAGSSVENEADDEKVHLPRGDLVWKMCRAMTTHWKHIVFFMLLLITAYAAIQSGPLKTKKASLPDPFFPLNSVVVDYFWGDVYRAFDRVQYADVTFIMFYAPWDAASMDIRWEFEKTSRYFADQISFAAVNCWFPNGECKQHFPKIRSFPLLIAYHINGKGIAFHGTPTFPYLVNFLEEFLRPVNVIHRQSDLYNLMAKRDAVVLGFFDFGASPMPVGFLNFYSTSLKALERDPEHDTAFAVVSNFREASTFGFQTSGSVQLHLWNEKLDYPGNGTLSPQKLLQWVSIKKSQVVKWLTLPWVKSRRLAAYLDSANPTLIMLTPRYFTSRLERSPYYYMLKELALEYNYCDLSLPVSNITRSIRELLQYTTFDDKSTVVECRHAMYKSGYISLCCASVFSQQRLLSVCVIGDEFQSEEIICKMLYKEIFLQKSWNFSGCQIRDLTYSSLYYVQVCPYHHRDEFVHFSYAVNPSNHKCAFLNNYNIHPGLSLHKERSHIRAPNITSQGCFTNRTLNFLALDSLRNEFLFEKLGISLSKTESRTAVAIIYAKQELYYVLNHDVTRHNLREFVMNFTQNELQRHRRSSSVLNDYSSSNQTMTVVEVTRNNFNEIVIDTKKDVVLLVYAPWCASCFGMYHVYLSVARYFQSSNNIIFTRINGDVNDLPWEFTVQNYPTVIIFPGHRKSESKSFPEGMAMTTKNLIHFLLVHAQDNVKLHSVLSLCSKRCVNHNKQLATNKISNLLKKYRELHLKLNQSVKEIEQQCANSTIPEMVPSYVENAEYLAEQLCGVRTKLAKAKSLHLVLSTTENQQILQKLMYEMLNDNSGLHRRNSTEPECDNFARNLKNEVKLCPRHLKSHLVFGQNSL